MKRALHILGRVLILLIFLAAAWLLYERLRNYTWQQVRDALAAISPWHIGVAALLTILNYLILVGYDWFAVRWVGVKDLPLRKIALASFTGYAFSYNFGATLFGTSIRYRLYSAWGMSLRKILDLLVILGLTFWFGVFTLAGVVFIAVPFRIPPQLEKLHLPFQHTFWVGVVLVSLAGAYVLFSAMSGPLQKWLGRRLPLPPLRLTLYQIGIACGDLLVAAAVLYVLLPPIDGGYLRILGIFMLAFVVAVLTHVPGGYGVFDALVIHFLTDEHGASAVAALLVFRVLYYWIPLLVAGVMLGYHELTLTHDAPSDQDKQL